MGLALLWSTAGLALEIPVSGRVSDPDGVPLASCRVELIAWPSAYQEGAELLLGERLEAVDRVTTDRDGVYTVVAPAPGQWKLRIGCLNHVEMTHPLQPLTEARQIPPAILHPGEPVEVRVTDPSGNPAADALVVVHPDLSEDPWSEQALVGWRPELRWTRSDAEGRARFLAAGDESLTAQAVGSGHAFSRVGTLAGSRGELRLRAGVRRVITPELPEGIEPGPILVRLGRFRWPVLLLDPAAPFALVSLPGRETTVWLESASGRMGAIVLPAVVEATAHTLQLQPPRSIRGRVIDGVSGQPIPGAVVWRDSRPSDFAVTDAAGAWKLDTPAQGSVALQAAAAGFLTRNSRVSGSPDQAVAEVQIRLQLANRTHGRIVSADGHPFQGGRVLATPVVAGPDFAEVAERIVTEVATDHRGEFEFPHLPAGSYRLELGGRVHADRAVRALDVFQVGTGAGEVDLGTIRLGAEVPLEGWVVTRDGATIAEARVTVRGPALPRPAETTTGADGVFQLEGFQAGDTVEIEVAHPRFQDLVRSGLVLPPEEPLEIVLTASAALAGRVLDEEGAPLGAARIEFRSSASPSANPTDVAVTTTSDPEGAFILPDLAPGSGRLSASADGYVRREIEMSAGAEAEVTVVLDRGWTVEGIVLTTDRLPVAGATVTLREPTRNPESQSSVSGGQGWFEISGLGSGRYDVSVRHSDYPERIEEIEVPVEGSGLRLVLEPGARVAGWVVDAEGRGVAGARVRLTQRSPSSREAPPEDVSGDAGEFEIDAVARGGYWLMAEKDGYANAFYPEELHLGDTAVEDLIVHLTEGARVQGRVLGLDPEELAGLTVSAFQPAGGRRIGRTESGGGYGGGGYVVDRLRPGEWTLRASVEGSDKVLERTVRIEADQAELEIDLEFERGVRLSGEIVVDDAPLEGVQVLLQGGEPPAPTYRTTSNASGRFELGASKPGGYLLTVLDRAGVIQHRERIDLTGDLHRRIVHGTGSLSGRLVQREQGGPARGARVILRRVAEGTLWVVRMTETGSEGRFAFDKVAAGEYQIGIEGWAGPPPSVRVEAGAQEHLGDLPIEVSTAE